MKLWHTILTFLLRIFYDSQWDNRRPWRNEPLPVKHK